MGLSDMTCVFPGSWAQDPEVLQTLEGQTVSVKCSYNPSYSLHQKIWCKQTSEGTCQPLVSSVSTGAEKLRFSIKNSSWFNFFTVTMTELKMSDSGIYHCGITGNSREITILRTIYLVVSKGFSNMPTPDIIPTTRLNKVPIPSTTKYSPSDTTTTRSVPKFPAVVSPPDPGVTNINGTVPGRVSLSIVTVPVVCGLLSKSLVFTVLFVVTQRSFG
ncbi:triggering receptor expressed on myeloid cells 1-like [Arvicanthis niloticus]|uniref:triggering receptor expressed on myeloid cells 1-like n=1 Tax=Arvicanthis niloticus TaxID=61156 RepID=UPI00402BC8D3